MVKQLSFEAEKSTTSILEYWETQGISIDAYINTAIRDSILPLDTSLRMEALYLLDHITDNAAAWSGAKLISTTKSEDTYFVTLQTIGRGITWLSHCHYIHNCSVLLDLANLYHSSPSDGGVSLAESDNQVNVTVRNAAAAMTSRLQSIDPDYRQMHPGLGALVRDILAHWSDLWDTPDAYRLIMIMVQCEYPIRKIEPYQALRILQTLESQYILETLSHTNG